MPYTKINFDESTPINAANLNHVETQYEKAIADVGGNMANSASQLNARVVLSFPALSAGQIFYHSGTGKFYYSTTTAHKVLAEKGQSQAVIA